MKTAGSVLLMVLIMSMIAVGTTHADSELSAVQSVLIVENGKPVGSLRSPTPGTELTVEVTSGDHQIQAIVQLHAVPGVRVLLLTHLDDVIITALSDEGVVGEVLEGGWSLTAEKEQMVHINLVGRSPVGASEYDLLQALVITNKLARTEFRVEGIVVGQRLSVPMLLTSIGGGAGVVMLAVIIFVLWRRSRSGSRWNY